MKPRTRASGDAHRAAILLAAATPGGFAAAGCTTMQFHCNALMAAGQLHQMLISRKLIRYFVTSEVAAEFRQAHLDGEIRKPAVVAVIKKLAPKVAKPKVIKLAKRTAKQQMQVVERKPYQAPAPRSDAVIIWPAHIKPVCRMIPERYPVSVQFQRIGQPGFSMSI
jgi:hypothetical protein